MSNLSLSIAVALFAIYVACMGRKPRAVKKEEDFTYEMDNVDREALLISRKIKEASTEPELWDVLGLIYKFELRNMGEANAYDHGKALRAQRDDRLLEVYETIQQTA